MTSHLPSTVHGLIVGVKLVELDEVSCETPGNTHVE